MDEKTKEVRFKKIMGKLEQIAKSVNLESEMESDSIKNFLYTIYERHGTPIDTQIIAQYSIKSGLKLLELQVSFCDDGEVMQSYTLFQPRKSPVEKKLNWRS